MKRLVLGLLLFFWIPTIGLAKDNTQFYVGVTGGFVIPRDLHEEWNNIAHTQIANLTETMNTGFLVGGKFGYTPTVLKKILAVELEYNYQKADLDKITSPGFTAGKSTISAFSSKANDSSINFHSVFFNIMARYPNGIIHPYLGIGPGVTRTSISFNEPNLTAEYGFVESGEDTGFSYQVLTGVDFDVTSNISLGVGYKYFTTKPTITWKNGTHSHYDPSSHNFVFDVKFHF
jgi:opacity protein-like surface antigen